MKIKVLFLILISFVAFSSCSDDEVDFNNHILGTWIPVMDENQEFPVDKTICIYKSDRTGITKYVTYTDINTYEERFSLNVDKIFFISSNEISVTSDSYLINSDGSIKVFENYRSTYSKHIDYLSNDSLVFVDNHNKNKKWHYVKLQ